MKAILLIVAGAIIALVVGCLILQSCGITVWPPRDEPGPE